MTVKLYNDLPAACQYCERSKMDELGMTCLKKGVVEPDDSCRAFVYDPLKRVPRQLPRLPEFDPDEFKW